MALDSSLSLYLTKQIHSNPARFPDNRFIFLYSLTPSKRRKNVAGAFAVRKRHAFAEKNICLVDDIATSGATLNECARALKMAGANKVFALVVAVAMQDD